MPSTSKKQHDFMAAVAHSPAFAKKAGVPKSVGKDFVAADKKMKFGAVKPARADLQKVNKPDTRQGKSELFAKGGDMKESKAMVKKEISFMKKKGAPASMIKHEKEEAMKKGGCTKMAKGGFTRAADGIAKKGKTQATQIKMKC